MDLFSLAASGRSEELDQDDAAVIRAEIQKAYSTHSTCSIRGQAHCTPDLIAPWRDGYRLANEYRISNDWGGDPLPDLATHMSNLGIDINEISLKSPSIYGLCFVGNKYRPTVRLNNKSTRASAPWSQAMTLAHELCHLLHDWRPGRDLSIISSDASDWPTEARANAFAAELVMPRSGVHECVASKSITPDTVERVMNRFKVGVRAATHHLKNLGYLSTEQRDELLKHFTSK